MELMRTHSPHGWLVGLSAGLACSFQLLALLTSVVCEEKLKHPHLAHIHVKPHLHQNNYLTGTTMQTLYSNTKLFLAGGAFSF